MRKHPWSQKHQAHRKLRAHLDLLSQQWGFEVGLDDHLDLQLSAAHLPDEGNNSEWQDDVLSGAIPASKGTKNTSLSRSKLKTHLMKNKQGFHYLKWTVWTHLESFEGPFNNFKHSLTSWAHTLHRGGWSWCYAPSQTYWDAHTGGRCSRRLLWTASHCKAQRERYTIERKY